MTFNKMLIVNTMWIAHLELAKNVLTQFMGKTVECLLYIHVFCTCSLTNKVILTQIYEDTYEVTSVQLVIFHKHHDGIVSAFHHG